MMANYIKQLNKVSGKKPSSAKLSGFLCIPYPPFPPTPHPPSAPEQPKPAKLARNVLLTF